MADGSTGGNGSVGGGGNSGSGGGASAPPPSTSDLLWGLALVLGIAGGILYYALPPKGSSAEAAAKLAVATVPPATTRRSLVPRDELRERISFHIRRDTVKPITILVITGARGTGKSTAALNALSGEKGVVYTPLTGVRLGKLADRWAIEECWAKAALKALNVGIEAPPKEDPWAAKAWNRETKAPPGEQPGTVLWSALRRIQDSGEQRPVFVIDVDEATSDNPVHFERLLWMCKWNGYDEGLADFVVVTTPPRNTPCDPIERYCGRVVEVGDLRNEEAERYIKAELSAWREKHKDAVITELEEKQLVEDVIGKCGARLLDLERLCYEWGGHSTLSDLRADMEDYENKHLVKAAGGLDSFLAKLPAAAGGRGRAKQREMLSQLASDSPKVYLHDAASAFGVHAERFEEMNHSVTPYQRPFIINPDNWKMRAASVFAQRAILQQVKVWEEEEQRRRA